MAALRARALLPIFKALPTVPLSVNTASIPKMTLLRSPSLLFHNVRLFSVSKTLETDIRYTTTHEWITVDGDIGTVGISEHAQSELGDVIFVELPDIGSEWAKGDGVAVIESVKTASDIFAPVSGTISETNPKLEDEPQLVNEAPLEKGWLFKMKVANKKELDDLMDDASYKISIAAQNH